jgi:hypothetical protein
VAAFCFTHGRSCAKKLALNQTPVINVTGKAFFDVGHSLKDQKLNRRSDHPHCVAWEIHSVMKLEIAESLAPDGHCC